MTQEAVGVENRTRKQAVSIFAGDDLAAMQVSGQDQVIAGMAGLFSRFAGCERTGHGHARRQGPQRRGPRPRSLARRCVTRAVRSWIHCPPPCSTASRTRFIPKLLVVVATNRQNRCDLAERANQVTQPAQLGGTVHQVASEQHHIRIAPGHGVQYLPTQGLGSTLSEVNVTDIQQSTRVVSRRESLLPDVQGGGAARFPALRRTTSTSSSGAAGNSRSGSMNCLPL